MIAGDAFGFPEIGVWVVPDVRCPKSSIAIRTGKAGNGRTHLLAQKNSRTAIRVRSLIAVGINLTVDRMRRSGDARLVEGDRQKLVQSTIPDVANIDKHRVGGLPLNIEGPVLGVGQSVLRIVTTEEK